jgi:hypothetical protein
MLFLPALTHCPTNVHPNLLSEKYSAAAAIQGKATTTKRSMEALETNLTDPVDSSGVVSWHPKIQLT